MDPYKDPTWIPIWILYGSLCGSYMGRLYVNVFTADPNMSIFNWKCANVLGGVWRSRMDPYTDPTWIPIWILYGSLCGSYMGRLYVNLFTADPTCQYFIGNMSKGVRGSLEELHGSLSGASMDPYMDLIWIPMWILYGSSICKCVRS